MPEAEALRAGPVRQCVESIGYQLVDLRDAARAGNIVGHELPETYR